MEHDVAFTEEQQPLVVRPDTAKKRVKKELTVLIVVGIFVLLGAAIFFATNEQPNYDPVTPEEMQRLRDSVKR